MESGGGSSVKEWLGSGIALHYLETWAESDWQSPRQGPSAKLQHRPEFVKDVLGDWILKCDVSLDPFTEAVKQLFGSISSSCKQRALVAVTQL